MELKPWKRLAVFDLDNTLIQGNSSFRFCHYLCRQKVFPAMFYLYSLWYFFHHHYFSMSLLDLHRTVFGRFLKGRKLISLERHVDKFLEKKAQHALYEPAVQLLRGAQSRGDYTVILSSSPDFLVGQFARYFGVNEWKATQYCIDKDGKLCNIQNLMLGREKARFVTKLAARLKIAKENITAYSDSHFDLPFLLEAGNVVLVNPDKTLRRLAIDRNWSVI